MLELPTLLKLTDWVLLLPTSTLPKPTLEGMIAICAWLAVIRIVRETTARKKGAE
jgi:hypothetical protein